MRLEACLGAAVVSTVLAACGPSGHIQAAASNAGSVALDDLSLQFIEGKGSQAVHFGTVAPGETSPLKAVDGATSCWSLSATVQGMAAKVTPIDCVGEHRLDPGDYTWILSAQGPGQLEVLRVDSPPRG